MKLSQFKYKLTDERIAQEPTPFRDDCRLMVVHAKSKYIEHRKSFRDVLDFFDEKDVFVFNDTKVFPARLYGNKEKTGARIEVFLLRELNKEMRLWDVLVDPARKIRIGNKLYSSKLKSTFGWSPRWNLEEAVEKVVEWSRCWKEHGDVSACMEKQIKAFISK